MYKAKENIGEFKKGDTVPDAQAIVWKDMYKESPVEEIAMTEKELKAEKKAEEKAAKEAKEKAESEGDETSEDSSNPMLEDYLGRNENVVKKNIIGDKLSKEQLEKLLNMEKKDKSRKKVIDALKHKLEVA